MKENGPRKFSGSSSLHEKEIKKQTKILPQGTLVLFGPFAYSHRQRTQNTMAASF